jgi:hypothetical protein
VIQTPNLDNRNFKDIVEEAIRLIPHYCPEWTNHNPTDPGITLLELFAWMSEMIIYRLNKVPEKTYLTLLDLIGFNLLPPQSAKALLSFSLVEDYNETVPVKKGLQLSTTKSEESDSIIFETEKEIILSNTQLISCISINEGLFTENIDLLTNNENLNKEFPLFSGKDNIQRHIYISDPAMEFLSDTNVMNIYFNCANEIKTINDEIINFLEWEYWNGKKWVWIDHQRSLPGIRKSDNEIYFIGPITLEPTEINGKKGLFFRGSLNTVPERRELFELNGVSVRLIFQGEGLIPDSCISNTDNMSFVQLDMNKEFKPFSGIPKYNDVFYIASDEVLSKENSEIIISIYLSDINIQQKKQEVNENLILKYEYWNDKNWVLLGETGLKGVHKPVGTFKFRDTTNALSTHGEIKFSRPNDMKTTLLNGEEHFWIRVRIGAGDFGSGGQHELDEHGKWVWRYEKPVESPIIKQIRLKYLANKKPPKHTISYYDYGYFDFTDLIEKNFSDLQDNPDATLSNFNVFEINKEKCPITYFGFDKKFPKGDFSIYFKIDEKNRVIINEKKTNELSKLGLTLPKKQRSIALKWEYWNGKKWEVLDVNDYTDSFHQSGFIEFKSPNDITLKQEFAKNAYWIRILFESGSFEKNPTIYNIHLNSVYAFNQQSFKDEVLGSSNGTPSQEFQFLHGPILPGIELIVKEKDLPMVAEREKIIEEEGRNAIIIKKDINDNDEYWVKYHPVENFYNSSSNSRHYCIDYKNNKIIFGDGMRGIIPPAIKNNIKVLTYKVGGGFIGNTGAKTIKILRENVPYVAKVINPYSAEGGADIEDLENLKSRATQVFKNLNRAVTTEDYEWLAKESSTSVTRAKCLSKCGKNGEVIVVVVPKPATSSIKLKEKLFPTSELIRRVKEYLDPRKLVGTKIRIESPVYKSITINLRIVFKKSLGEIQILKERVELALFKFFHPVYGGPEGKGWPFGMSVGKNTVFTILEKIEGISFIEDIKIVDNDLNADVEKIVMEEDNLVFIDSINITEREYQY